MLSLPVCAWIKEVYPKCRLIFLGKKYTRPILESFSAIDEIKCWDELEQQSEPSIISEIRSWKADAFVHVFPDKRIAKLVRKAKVPLRVGTSHRAFHFLTCNHRPNFTRKHSELHEAQLNFELFHVFGMKQAPDLERIQPWLSAHFKPTIEIGATLNKLVQTDRKTIILHPKSQGSAVEWPIEKYIDLALNLVDKDFRVFFSGTEKEGRLFRGELPTHPEIIDISGTMKLDEFITFINNADALVACSTGPLHIAAVLGKQAIGLYTKIRPMHPGRWAPVGKNVQIITTQKKMSTPLEEIESISVHQLLEKL